MENIWDTESNANRRLALYWVGGTCFKLKEDIASEHSHANNPDANAQSAHCKVHLMKHDTGTRGMHPMSLPREPFPEERAEHDMHHATYAAWCPHCVARQRRQE